ncbi:MAG: peptidoglycan-binding domain-containing protein [bacterium]|nr:peptidoglycan-binding domain-containing protein [bacterium]
MRTGGTVLACLGALGAGIVGGLWAAAGAAPSSEPPSDSWVPVEVSEFDDARGVSATLDVSDPQVVVIGADGRLTASQCAPGSTFDSGEVIASVDGSPVMALATRVPLWRDLASGMRGEDVAAVQAELNRLGAELAEDGHFGSATAAAVSALWTEAGAPDPRGRISVDHVAWLFAPAVPVESCEVHLGEEIGGSPLATALRTPTGIRLTSVPQDAVPGDRTLTYGGASVLDDGTGVISSPEMIEAMASSETYRLWLIDPAMTELTFTLDYALASPLSILTLPPASVGRGGGIHCVESREETIQVEIVGSQLGSTFVTVNGQAPTEVRVPRPGEQIDCQ